MEVKWVLGRLLERNRSARRLRFPQEAFIDSILARFNLLDASTVTTPLPRGSHLSAADCPTSKQDIATRPYRELVGALAWLALGSRPDIVFSTSSLAQADTTPAVFIGKRPNESSNTLRQIKSDVSC